MLTIPPEHKCRQQVGEVLPVAMRALEKSMGKSTEEITKMLELGQIGTDVLPAFGQELKNIAREGGGLAAALKTVRVQESRLFSKLQTSQETIFNSGFGDGISDFYKKMMQSLERLEPAMKVLGSTFKWLFKIIASSVQFLAAPIEALGYMLEAVRGLNGASSDFVEQGVPKLVAGALLIRSAWGKVLIGFVAIVAVLEEMYALLNKNVVGEIERQVGLDFGIGGDEDTSKLLNPENKDSKKDQGYLEKTFNSTLNKAQESFDYWTSWRPVGDLLGVTGMGTALPPPNIIVNNNQQPTIDEYGNVNIENTVSQSIVNGQAQR